MSLPLPTLDHLILFLPLDQENRTPAIPASLSSSFTLTPGGTHADNLTGNTLILLADGAYLELISFLSSDPARIGHHWWGPDPQRQGWSDWCLSSASPADENFEQRLAEGRRYVAPRKGGRLRPDGVQVKWAVTFPAGENGGRENRSRLPFWCHDDPVTARHLRVPISEEKVTHSSGVLGVHSITIVMKDRALLEDTRKVYTSIFGQERESLDSGEVVFEAGRTREVEGLQGGARIVLRVAKEEEAGRVQERGFSYGDVAFAVKAGDGRTVGDRVRIDAAEGEGALGGLWIEYI